MRHARQIGAEGVGAGADGLPGARVVRLHVIVAFPRTVRGRLAPRMRDLHAGNGAVLLEESDDARPLRGLFVVPDAGAARRDAALGRDGGRLGDDQAGTADGVRAEMDQVPVVDDAVIRRVLAHRRHRDAVLQRDGFERELVEQGGHESLRIAMGDTYPPCIAIASRSGLSVQIASRPSAISRFMSCGIVDGPGAHLQPQGARFRDGCGIDVGESGKPAVVRPPP